LTGERQNGCQPDGANLVPGLMPRRSAGAPAPYRGSALQNARKDSLNFCLERKKGGRARVSPARRRASL
jgi:hypothetical protein